MHLVVELPPRLNDRAIAMAAAANDLYVMPLSWCFLGRPTRQGLVLGYGGTRAADIRPAVKRLEAIIREVGASRSVA